MSFKDFNEVIIAFQDPNSDTKSTWYRQKSDNNNRRCLQCKIQLSSSNLGPYCSTACMKKHDAGIPGATTKETDINSNIMRKFSEVLSQ